MTTTESTDDLTTGMPLTVTESALATVLEVRAGEDDPAGTALRVAITGANMTEFAYSLDLVPIAEAADDDAVYTQGTHGELTVIVPAGSVDNMMGATLDVPSASAAGGLVIRNPNTPNPLAGLDLELTGELPEKVQAVLDQAVNPALASHGGFARLVGIDGTRVFVTMGGGCQGCAASAMTLRDGIRAMLMDALPEITDVVDATDHAAGENPFYS
ncbi:MAG: NifU family protein [Acidimicrobiia bacterium]|nr:NifU family protein [Acidimicrobiia bacterium]